MCLCARQGHSNAGVLRDDLVRMYIVQRLRGDSFDVTPSGVQRTVSHRPSGSDSAPLGILSQHCLLSAATIYQHMLPGGLFFVRIQNTVTRGSLTA